jgi:hypothetical protein
MVSFLLLLLALPIAVLTPSAATTTTARATPTVVRKCVLDTTFSSPPVENPVPGYSETETGVKFDSIKIWGSYDAARAP